MIESSLASTLPLVRTSQVDSPPQTLPGLMLDLVNGLTHSPARGLRPSKRSDVHRYHDEEFDYVEFAMDGVEEVEADICIHGGRIFVRIAR